MNSPWQYSIIHNSACKVIEEQTLWGQKVCRIWLPNADAVVRVPASGLIPLASRPSSLSTDHITYVAAAAKVAEVLEHTGRVPEGHVLLAPMESNVIPLPHQLKALSRAVSGNRIRYLLADEVGLGKTIEAGLILRELKLRGLIRRILIVAPKGLATQWVAEMETHFNEAFQLILGEDIGLLERYRATDKGYQSVWASFDQVIVSLDSIKPMERRRGWTRERIEAYNSKRFDEITSAGWDLIIVDEAHRLGGSTDQVARYKLGRGLADAAPYLLLLSATPHQGKSDAFHRLMSLIDETAFPDPESVTRERVMPYIIRTEKRMALDAHGQPLFKPRITQMAAVRWEPHHQLQEQLYETVTVYVKAGYNLALLAKKRHIGFLMILMQRLVVSSTRAIRTTLERRLQHLAAGQQQLSFHLEELDNDPDNRELLADLYDLDGQDQLDELLQSQSLAVSNEIEQVKWLHSLAVRCEHTGPDAKAEALLDWIYKLQADENEPELKVLIFTEFVPTQQMLEEFLSSRGFSVVTLNGSLDMEARKAVQQAFRETHRILISTDAGGEGLNLQFAHVIINYDIPWNPMRLEQRIGRVDRIGQPKTVRAINFVFEDSVEFRVREVLEEKLSVIFEEFGIDKTGDVLDTAQAGELFESLFSEALLKPDEIEQQVDQSMKALRREIYRYRSESPVYGVADAPVPEAAERLRTHPFPHWVETMTVSYVNANGGSAVKNRSWWDITWPNGQSDRKCVFNAGEAARLKGARLLNLTNTKVNTLTKRLPQFNEGYPIPRLRLSRLPAHISGTWGLFQVSLHTSQRDLESTLLKIPQSSRGFVCVFVNTEGKVYLPTARHIWESLVSGEAEMMGFDEAKDRSQVLARVQQAAEEAGQEVYENLKHQHEEMLLREDERGSTYYASQRKAVARIGLPEVRQYRLSKLDAEEHKWRQQLKTHGFVIPEFRPLLILTINYGVQQ